MENYSYMLSAGLEFFYALVSIILLIGCLLDHNRKGNISRIMIVMLIIHAFMNAIDACIWLWCDIPELLILMKILTFLSYTFASAILVLFSLLLVTNIRENASVPKWINCSIIGCGAFMSVLSIVSVFNGMFYYWDENCLCQPGKLFWLSQVLGIILLLSNIVLVLFYRKTMEKKDAAVFVLYSVIPLASFFLIPYWDVTPLYTATTIVLLLYYIVIHVEHGQRVAEQQTMLVRQELELTNSRTTIMLTQIRPHFLYNTLTAVAQLCEKDPLMAKQVTLDFSEYLRQNINSLDQKTSIPFTKELEHIRHYLAIEQVRFGELLHVIFDIQVESFALPVLSLQPIVENAVKHGVGMKEDGGTVIISSRESADYYEVTVSDDGIGFNNSELLLTDKKHIGIKLVKTRLEELVGGSMQIESRPGIGTTVTIFIPKDLT